MAERKSGKRKVITAVVIVGVFALLIGSFFLRDICLRAGITECEKREILQVKSKYSAILDSVVSAGNDIGSILQAASDAASAGMENSKRFASRFGRAKSYGEQTIGTPDAGAASTAFFFNGLLQGYQSLQP